MAKGIYIGIDGVAKKIKKPYIGVGGIVKGIKKIYVGVDGSIRLAWSAGLDKASNAANLIEARYDLAGASVGNYALFAGGTIGGYISGGTNARKLVDAYNSSLVRTNAGDLTGASPGRANLAGASVGDYALFAGGEPPGISSADDKLVDAYNSSLVKTAATALGGGRADLAGASVGDYALFAGGDATSPTNRVDAYDSSLVRTSPTTLSVARADLTGVRVGNYALFAGGGHFDVDDSLTVSNVVNAYDTSLVRTNPTTMSSQRRDLVGATVGDYALLACGRGVNTSITNTNRVDAYSSTLVKTNPLNLATPKYNLAGATIGNYAIFAGGYNYISAHLYYGEIEVFDNNLVKVDTSSIPALSQSRGNLASAVVGDYALFAGGKDSSSNLATVEVYGI